MLQQISGIGWRIFLVVAIVSMAYARSADAQIQPMVPVTPRAGTQTQVAAQTINQPVIPSGTQTNTQNTNAWRPIQPATQGYRIASASQPIYGATQPSYQPRAGFDGFAVNSVPAFGVMNATYNPPVYQVAQLPQQGIPQQYAQPPPVYVPQSYVTPGTQPYPGLGAGNPAQFGFNNFQPLWTGQLSVLYMTRTESSSFPLLINGGGMTVVDANQLDFGWTSGYDIGLSRKYGPSMNFELRYFQIDGWTALYSSPFAGTDALTTSPLTPTVIPGTVNYFYDSLLRSFEANFVNRLSTYGSGRLAIGFRWLTVRENLLQTFATALPMDPTYNISTKNNLYGLQLGSDGTCYNNRRFAVNWWIKGGVYANVGSQDSTVDTFGLATGIDKTTVAFMGETGLIADFQLFPNVSLIGGYQLLYISGVALAADQQLNMSSFASGLVPARLDHSDVFYHGALVGIDFHW